MTKNPENPDQFDQLVVFSIRVPGSLAARLIQKVATIINLVDEREGRRGFHIFCRPIDDIDEYERQDLIYILGEGNDSSYDLFRERS